MTRTLTLVALAASLAIAPAFPALAATTRADDPEWPRQFDSPIGSFVVYQPQPEDLVGDVVTGRAAFSLRKEGVPGPTFGVLWYAERIEIDRDSSTVTTRNLEITKVRLPGITAAEAEEYEELVETEAAEWDLSDSVEELQAGLAATEKERASVAGLDNAPPRILFHDRRAILVVYDGTPLMGSIEGSTLERAVNTPYAVLLDPSDGTYYLNGANLWYHAKHPLGPWTVISDPPADVRGIVPPDTSSSDQVTGTPPEVLTAIEPTELIATDGAPRYASLVDGELLYVANTESDVVLEVSTQSLYVLLSGRWFRAPSADGPWTFVPGNQLPASFRQVPLDSPKGNILASVAGTDQADDAIADAEIPQTSEIRRDDESFEATYDGEPQFEPIEGTDLQYSVNTYADVILSYGRFYACDQGVWYVADSPYGPWIVSDSRPLGVEDIPPSCPVFSVRYVYIYDSTPTTVTMGYLPGYLGWYPCYGTVVYGTGYEYSPWRSRYRYYPRRFTWGFNARYNPWLSRWSFGSTYGTGFLRVGARWQSGALYAQRKTRSAWFGPGGYRRPLVAQDLTLLRSRRPGRARSGVRDGLPANVYNRSENIARVDQSVKPVPVRSIAAPIPRRVTVPDNVFAGRDGNVYRRDTSGSWEMRKDTEWKPTELPSPPPAPPAQQTPPETRRSSIERPVPPRDSPRERPTTRSEPPTPPQERPSHQERPTPPEERPSQRERPAKRQEQQPTPQEQQPPAPPEEPPQSRERPAPPEESPSPGDLEREFRARQRSEPQKEERQEKSEQQESRRETQRERTKGSAKP